MLGNKCNQVIEYMVQIEQNKKQLQEFEQKIDLQKHEKMKRTKKALSRKLVRYFLKQDLHKLQTFCKEYNMEAQQRIAINSNIRTIRPSYMRTSRGGHSLLISLSKHDTKNNIRKTCKQILNTKYGKKLLALMLKSKD